MATRQFIEEGQAILKDIDFLTDAQATLALCASFKVIGYDEAGKQVFDSQTFYDSIPASITGLATAIDDLVQAAADGFDVEVDSVLTTKENELTALSDV